jgi:hypothetical protein
MDELRPSLHYGATKPTSPEQKSDGLIQTGPLLSGKAGVELLRPAPNDLLRIWPVSKRVNVVGRGDEDPSLIEVVEDEAAASLLTAVSIARPS